MEHQVENKFNDTILEDIGEIPVSNTQKIRVLKVQDTTTKEIFLSVQKWWRLNKEESWRVGKGFKLTVDQADTLHGILGLGVLEARHEAK